MTLPDVPLRGAAAKIRDEWHRRDDGLIHHAVADLLVVAADEGMKLTDEAPDVLDAAIAVANAYLAS